MEAHRAAIINCDYYYNMKYLLPCSTFIKVPQGTVFVADESLVYCKLYFHMRLKVIYMNNLMFCIVKLQKTRKLVVKHHPQSPVRLT